MARKSSKENTTYLGECISRIRAGATVWWSSIKKDIYDVLKPDAVIPLFDLDGKTCKYLKSFTEFIEPAEQYFNRTADEWAKTAAKPLSDTENEKVNI